MNDTWHEELDVFSLLPEHPTRPVALAMLGINRGAQDQMNRLTWLARTAHRLGPIGALGLLAVASDVPTKHRPGIAFALQEAWHAGRITADDLVAGWRHEAREVVGVSPGKTIPMLVELAEGACLALVWPLLVEIAEELTAERATATTSAALEAVLRFLPEVPHPVALPNIQALATSKGSSKAIRTARLIQEQL